MHNGTVRAVIEPNVDLLGRIFIQGIYIRTNHVIAEMTGNQPGIARNQQSQRQNIVLDTFPPTQQAEDSTIRVNNLQRE
jgi:hypothetical protein